MQETTHVLTPFGWPVVIYLTLAGVAAGCALVSAWKLLRGAAGEDAPGHRSAVRGLGLAAAVIATGSVALIADLEAPSRFWLILAHFNPGSVIAWGARIIALFGIFCACVWIALRRQPSTELTPGMRFPVGLIAVLALGVGLDPGWVLLQAVARPLWDSPWIAPLFLASAIHTGLAATLLLGPSSGGNGPRRTVFGFRAEALLVVTQAIFVAVWLLSATPGYADAAQRIIRGELAIWLWGGVVLLGWLVPLGFALARDSGRAVQALRAAAVLIGGLALRTVIVFGGQGSAALLATTLP